MLPIYTEPLANINVDLSRQLDLSTQFDLTEDNPGAIQEYVLGLSDYKTFTWTAPLKVYIYYIGTFHSLELPLDFINSELPKQFDLEELP